MNPKTFISLTALLWAGCLFVGCGPKQKSDGQQDVFEDKHLTPPY